MSSLEAYYRERAELAEAECERLRKDVELSLELAEEGWGYASEYFQEKWEFRERVEEIRKRSTSDPTPKESP